MSNWYDYFNKNKQNYITVKLSSEEDAKIRSLAQHMQEKIEYDFQIAKDSKNYIARWIIGLAGEIAVSRVLKTMGIIESMDNYKLSVGLSENYDTPDFLMYGLNLGCKTCVENSCIKVKENCHNSEVICFYNRPTNEVVICGIATREVLEQYSDLDLIENPDIRAKAGTSAGKVGFNRFDKLIPFTKENILSYKADMKLKEYKSIKASHPFNSKMQKGYIALDKNNGKLIMRTVDANKNVEIYDTEWPLTKESMKIVKAFINKGYLICGYHAKNILQHIQSVWCFEEVEVEYADLYEGLSDKYEYIKKHNESGRDFLMLDNLMKMNHKANDIEALSNLCLVYSSVIPISQWNVTDSYMGAMKLVLFWYRS